MDRRSTASLHSRKSVLDEAFANPAASLSPATICPVQTEQYAPLMGSGFPMCTPLREALRRCESLGRRATAIAFSRPVASERISTCGIRQKLNRLILPRVSPIRSWHPPDARLNRGTSRSVFDASSTRMRQLCPPANRMFAEAQPQLIRKLSSKSENVLNPRRRIASQFSSRKCLITAIRSRTVGHLRSHFSSPRCGCNMSICTTHSLSSTSDYVGSGSMMYGP